MRMVRERITEQVRMGLMPLRTSKLLSLLTDCYFRAEGVENGLGDMHPAKKKE